MAFCGNCGSHVSDSARFCGTCGATIGAAAPAPQPVEPVGPAMGYEAGGTYVGAPEGAPVAPGDPGVRRGMPMGVVVAASLAGVLLLAGIGVGAFLLVRSFNSVDTARRAEASGPNASAATTAPVEPTSANPETTLADTDEEQLGEPIPSGKVTNLRKPPKKGTSRARTRQQLLDAARDEFETSSLFYVNQLWVSGGYAVGDIAAERAGRRICVVWREDPWRVVAVLSWGDAGADAVRQEAPDVPEVLIRTVDWSRSWPKEFKLR